MEVMPRDKAFRTIANHIYNVFKKGRKFGDPIYIVLADSFDEASEIVAKEYGGDPDDFYSVRVAHTDNPQIYKL